MVLSYGNCAERDFVIKRRKQIKEEKREVTSSKTVTATKEPHVEVESIKAKSYTAIGRRS